MCAPSWLSFSTVYCRDASSARLQHGVMKIEAQLAARSLDQMALKIIDSAHPQRCGRLCVLDAMADQQRAKVLSVARRVVPHLTAEDVLNPHDFDELRSSPEFHYEDGILAGILAAEAALRALSKRQE